MDPLPIKLKHLSYTQLQSFWAKVDKTCPNGCWNWTASKLLDGYAQFEIGSRKHKTHQRVLAHRLSYEMAKGAIPSHLELDHLCRNRACTNPDHLEPVTTQENIRRSSVLGQTWTQGEKHGLAKLSNAQAAAIRDAEGTQAAIAKAYGVSRSTVSNIKTGRNWKHIQEAA